MNTIQNNNIYYSITLGNANYHEAIYSINGYINRIDATPFYNSKSSLFAGENFFFICREDRVIFIQSSEWIDVFLGSCDTDKCVEWI